MMSLFVRGSVLEPLNSGVFLAENDLSPNLLIFVDQLVNICYKFANICCPASCIASYYLLQVC